MKRIVLLGLLAQASYAAQVTVNFLSSSQQLSDAGTVIAPGDITESNKPIGCRKRNFDGTCVGGPCDCPLGSICVEGAGVEPNVCTVQTEKAAPGSSSVFDYSAASLVSVPTQVPFLEDFTDIVTDGNADYGRKDKYHLARVVIKGMADPSKYTACSVSLSGAIIDGNPSILPVTQDKVFAQSTGSDQTKNVATCEFRTLNKGYLGNIDVDVTFTKDLSKARLDGECLLVGQAECEDKIEVRLKYIASEDDVKWHDHEFNTAHFDKVFPSHDPSATSDHYKTKSDNSDGSAEVFRFNTFSGKGFDDSNAYAIRGLLALPIEGIFYDARYRIVDQTGISGLLLKIGDLKLRKEGLELHDDFKGFADPTKNVFDNDSVDMDPVALFSDYDRSNLDSSLSEVAQYKLDHIYGMIYGGHDRRQLPHFDKSYLGCPVCDGRITVKGFKQSNAYADATRGDVDAEQFQLRYHTSIDSSALPTSSNTFDIKDIDIEAVSDGKFLPTSDDTVHPSGRALGEVFEVAQASSKITFNALTDSFNILGSRITFGTGLSGVGCDDTEGKLYQFADDISDHAKDLFDLTCKIQVSKDSFGREMTIDYANAAGSSHQAKITETDLRVIAVDNLGNTELSLYSRKVDPDAQTNGNLVSFQIRKSGVSGALEFTVKGRNTMVGYDLDGNKCTEIDTASGCHGLISAEEETLTTSADDNVAVTHTVRSSPDCLFNFDIQLVDNAQPWAKYDLRLPCVQSSGAISDSITLKYHFEGHYELGTDKYTATISYDNDNGKLGVLQAGFGKCGKATDGSDVLIVPDSCKEVDVTYKADGDAGYDDTPVHFPLYNPGQNATEGWTETNNSKF
tara:strand:+ start:4212 stop:6758 length:2547 start_codon:yes stop_codon:yes gene_type:complete